ncbi:MAG: type III pantothenate kinase [Clostridia bacterium]|nr:type III pantothenate kinase [Clostridia bacterium]
MLFAVDIGNTNIHVGAFKNDQLKATFSLGLDMRRTADEYAMLLRALCADKGVLLDAVTGAVLGSVVPTVTPVFLHALKALLGVPVTVVGPGVKTGFSIRLDNPAELGADLAANAAGAIACVGAPVIIVDFGTATTVIAVDERSALQGGAIMPGVGMSLHALDGAALLPDVPACGGVEALGKNTPDCMRAGVVRGGAMAACGLAEQYKRILKLPMSTPLVVCGGYAEVMRAYLPANTQYIPELTLCGLAAIYRLNQK